jgi:cobyrinic acid a,c-diamide synthase
MQQIKKTVPGLVVAGLRGGSGKTVISLGIAAAWSNSEIEVAPFKKGPDYIDAGWLSLAAGRSCYNLDTYLCTPPQVEHSFYSHCRDCDISVVEGNRGLFDGIDLEGRTSTAELAKLLNLPVLLVLDCTKSTRTMAALLLGCMHFDPDLTILGVVLNRVAGKRHENKVRDNIKQFCDLPVFGSVPKLSARDFPERHMGLVPIEEHALAMDSVTAAAKVARDYIDLDRIHQACMETASRVPSREPREQSVSASQVAATATTVSTARPASTPSFLPKGEDDGPVVGIIKDSAFQFYYPDNLEALEACGAKLRYISPLKESVIPHMDAIYMGGGFPETHAPQLAANKEFRENLRSLASQGLPIYAECGGFIFLGERLLLDGVSYDMAGVLPVHFGLSKRPVGHGYTQVKVVEDNPYYKKGETIKGHEFRYSTVLDLDRTQGTMAFAMDRGKGILNKQDGFFRDNVFATYTHILASGTPSWAESIIRQALAYRNR